MEPDTADILGQRTMPVAHRNSSIRFSFSATWFAFFIVALSVCYALGVRFWRRFLLWRERSYKLATRRRYGIPDNDLRPFNVAYTDALMRAREEELAISRPPLHSQVPVVSGAQGEAVSGHTLRQRSVANTSLRSTTVPVPGGYSSRYNESMPPPAHRSADDLLPNGHALANTHVRHAPILNRRAAHQSINAAAQVGTSSNEARKRSWHTDQDEEHEAKKTRVEGEELIDGDEDAEFDENALELGVLYEGGSDAATETRKSSGKRTRRVSAEKAPEGHQADQNMDVDDEEMDDITELKPISRGKKRDRAEAGSTFGGDDEDSTAEHEADGDSKLRRRRRKRRTVAKRKSEASYLRGKKREREGDEDLTDENSEESLKLSSSQRKRGKRSSNVHHYEIERQKSDVSMDESVTSSKNKVREIGEEWENNGIRYKIGLNGQRLRQALVKKARQRFIMPKDSQHPDRDANMQVCIECWLTEEDYQQAKADHLLAWQDSPKQPEDGEKLSLDTSQRGVPFPQGIPGKNLLWSASASTTPTISPASHSPSDSGQEIPQQRKSHASYRHSIATSVGLPILPFNTSTMTAVKRISSTSRAFSLTGSVNGHILVNGADSPGTPGLSDSTNASPRTPAPTKVFSKWEKQELEAKAIMKMRDANRKKEKEKEAKETKEREEREAKEKAERERAAAAAEQARLVKERQEKEKAEKERKEKEAAAASSAAPNVPSVIVTAPSTGGTPASETASVPNNFFALSTTASKPAEGTSTGQAPSIPNFFAKSAEPAKFASADQFSFGVPGTVAAGEGTSAAAPGTNPTPSGFTFGHPQHKSSASGIATSATSPGESTGAPLFSRIGPPAAAEKPQNPAFSFVKPESTPASTPAAPFSTTPATPAASTTNVTMGGTTPATGATTAPKFSFNFGKTSTNAAVSTIPTASAPATAMSSTTTPSDKKDTATPLFSFKPSAAPITGATTTPKFGFGTPAFGTGGTTATASKEPAKPVFGSTTTTTPTFFGGGSSTSANSVFGNTGGSSSAFGNTGSSASVFGKTNTSPAFSASGSTPSPFGATSTPSPFGASNTANLFGPTTTTTTTNTKANESKAFNFANPSSSTVPTSSSSGTGSTFNFGITPSTTPASGGSGFSFKTPTSTTTPQSSPFGMAASTGPSVFGKAPETSSTTPSSSSTTAPAPVFNFGAMSTGQQK